ncbi:hypothetical protein BDR26DRAFT_858382 [Obelidium mucronatum]|nr:hypothetical protein BDR26DRAFT_858382 [Obelidium mucronatum]
MNCAIALLYVATMAVDALPAVALLFSLRQLHALLSASILNHDNDNNNNNNFAINNNNNDATSSKISVLSLYLNIEAAFLIYFVLQFYRLQKPIPPASITCPLERKRILSNALESTIAPSCHSTSSSLNSDSSRSIIPIDRFTAFFAPWFVNSSNSLAIPLSPSEFHLIRRDNFRDWFAWLLYSSRDFKQLHETSPDLSKELDSFLVEFETRKKIVIQPGRNKEIEPVILSYNPVNAYPKPLAFYACISLVESIGHLLFSFLGFKRIVSRDRRYVFHPLDPDTDVHYWVLQPLKKKEAVSTSEKTLPIVFFHGIGCGLFPYINFVMEMSKLSPNTTIFLVELPHVAMRFVERVPSMEQTVSEVENMLDMFGYKKAMVVGHSLGSASAAWMIKNSKYVVASVLLDPIVFLTLHPSLAYNFVHRHPGRNTSSLKVNEIMMHWLCSRELHISYTISRHFIWHQSILWADDLPKNHHVVISRKDLLVDARVIEDCLYFFFIFLFHLAC